MDVSPSCAVGRGTLSPSRFRRRLGLISGDAASNNVSSLFLHIHQPTCTSNNKMSSWSIWSERTSRQAKLMIVNDSYNYMTCRWFSAESRGIQSWWSILSRHQQQVTRNVIFIYDFLRKIICKSSHSLQTSWRFFKVKTVLCQHRQHATVVNSNVTRLCCWSVSICILT